MSRLIALTAIAMALITFVPLTVALIIWIRNRVRKRRADQLQMWLELHKAVSRHTEKNESMEAQIYRRMMQTRELGERINNHSDNLRKLSGRVPQPMFEALKSVEHDWLVSKYCEMDDEELAEHIAVWGSGEEVRCG